MTLVFILIFGRNDAVLRMDRFMYHYCSIALDIYDNPSM